MARNRVRAPEPVTKVRRAKASALATAPRGAVRVVPEVLGGTKLVTVDADHPYWSNPHVRDKVWRGGFYRLRPPPGAEESAEVLRKALLEQGAALVKIVPPAQQAVIPQAVAASAAEESIDARAACEQLVEAAVTEDRGALRVMVDELLSGVGL